MTRPYYYIRKIATMANKQKRCRIPIIVLPGGQGVVIKKKNASLLTGRVGFIIRKRANLSYDSWSTDPEEH